MKHPVDIHVGQRVRHRRWMLGMPQQQLGDKIGVTIPQIQNYENGTNRISASRLSTSGRTGNAHTKRCSRTDRTSRRTPAARSHRSSIHQHLCMAVRSRFPTAASR